MHATSTKFQGAQQSKRRRTCDWRRPHFVGIADSLVEILFLRIGQTQELMGMYCRPTMRNLAKHIQHCSIAKSVIIKQ